MKRFRFAAPVIALGALVVLVACGGEEPTNRPVSPTPIATAAPIVGTPTVLAPPTIAPTAASTATPIPADTPTPEPPLALPTAFQDHGFALIVERGADIQTLGAASTQQGAITMAYGEVNILLTWLPQGSSILALVSGTYDLLQNSQPESTFETLTDGSLLVDGEPGVFLGFKTEEASGEISGGLIGAWDCALSDTAFIVALTGADTVLVQIRFDEILDNFSCVAS